MEVVAHGVCLLCACVFSTRLDTQQSLNVLPGKGAAEVVADAGAHGRQRTTVGAGQVEELVPGPEGAAREVS